MDIIQKIVDFNAGRDLELLALKYQKMRASAFAFMRGSNHLFYEQLFTRSLPKNVPNVWISGDLHLENFGTYKADNRLVYFDVNDFDEAVLAPASWELIRLLTSIWVSAEGAAGPVTHSRAMCECFLQNYSEALCTGKAYWVERDTAQGPVHALLNRLRERKRVDFLVARTHLKGRKRVLSIDGTKALPISKAQRAQVMEFMASFAKSQPDPDFYTVIDVARRVAGTGSLGLERFVILVKGKSSPDANYLLDLKIASPSCLLPYLTTKQARWETHAHRVVALQQRSQAVPMAFLHPVRMDNKAYVLRALQPSEDRVAITPEKMGSAHMTELIASMGRIVAWMHLRSAGRQGSANADELIEFGTQRKWQQRLLNLSATCAQQVIADADVFNAAFDTGVFNAPSEL